MASANWESLIGAKIEAHRDTHKVCKVKDARERNKRQQQLKWKREHRAEEKRIFPIPVIRSLCAVNGSLAQWKSGYGSYAHYSTSFMRSVRVRAPQEPLTIDGKESATKVNSSDPVNHTLIPMAAVAQATTHTHFIYHFQPPEGTSLHGTKQSPNENNSRVR